MDICLRRNIEIEVVLKNDLDMEEKKKFIPLEELEIYKLARKLSAIS